MATGSFDPNWSAQGFTGSGLGAGSQLKSWLYGGKQSLAFSEKQLAEQSRQFNERLGLYNQQLDLQKQALQTGGGGLASMINEYNTALAEAKADAEQRYQESLSVVNTLGTQRQADIVSDYQRRLASEQQQLRRTGLYNPLTAKAATAGTMREQNAELNRLNESVAAQRLGVLQSKKDYLPPESNISTMADYLSSIYSNIGKLNV